MTATQVVTAYLAAYNRLRNITAEQISRVWDQVGGLDDASLDQFLGRTLPLMRGAETATVRLTSSYLTALRRETLGSARTATVDPRHIIGERLRGTSPTDVFARPTVTARTAIAAGQPFEEAMRLARLRAGELASTNIVLTQRATTVEMGKTDSRVAGYRRVLTGTSCPLCTTASTQRYHQGQLHPIHSHCDCGVAEIYGNADPGQVINKPLLDRLKADTAAKKRAAAQRIEANDRAAERTQARLKDIDAALQKEPAGSRRRQLEAQHQTMRDRAEAEQRNRTTFSRDAEEADTVGAYAVHHHGELGPVLTRHGDHFTTEAEALH